MPNNYHMKGMTTWSTTCGPSRGARASGRTSDHTGITSNSGHAKQLKNFAGGGYGAWFKEAGARTFIGGKIHGYARPQNPPTADNFLMPGWDDHWVFVAGDNKYTGVDIIHAVNGGPAFTTETLTGNDSMNYTTERMRIEAILWLEEHASLTGPPVFMWLNPYTPHSPWVVYTDDKDINVDPLPRRPSEDVTDVVAARMPQFVIDSPQLTSTQLNQTQVTNKRIQMQTCLSGDRLVEGLLDWLDASGLRSKTWLSVSTDNGTTHGRMQRECYRISNATAGKSWWFPEMFNPSCYIFAPDDLTARPQVIIDILWDDLPADWTHLSRIFPFLNQRLATEGVIENNALCSTLDFAPTFCRLLRAKPPAGVVLDGIDLITTIKNGSRRQEIDGAQLNNDQIGHCWWGLKGLFDGKSWSYVEHYPNPAGVSSRELIGVELFNLTDDFDCTYNLAGLAQYASVQTEMAARMASLKVQTHGQALAASRPLLSSGTQAPAYVNYNGTPVEVQHTVE